MKIQSNHKNINSTIQLGGSKSISNRLLILDSLFENKIKLKNLSDAEDTDLLKKALQNPNEKIVDIHHAGTAMRFLTSYLSLQNQEKILTGSERMKQRPIGILVEALKSMGISIEYLEKEGFPPLKINPSEFKTNKVQIQANTSSQYITSLLLIGSKLPNGLELELIGKITSLPYLEMTLTMLRDLGIDAKREENIITIKHKSDFKEQNFTIESDWSSASYHYSIATIADECRLEISYLFKDSLQGDRRIADIYKENFGINTEFKEEKILLTKIPNFSFPEKIELNLNDCPDIAQTIAVTCSALKIPALLTGLETLKIKETDRIVALQNELKKCGTTTKATTDSLELISFSEISEIPSIATYNDHRMAMCFAPLALVHELDIQDKDVVQKSYPNFWNDMKKLGFTLD
ncbi:MAG: 3-phosphoshikimate 1-carboxyvinyltransferase [Flavobacteriales bacterium]|nr:3-phosphoshikimate 1-carboxyvinyltransferase [Flavobacteriales bacterium]